MEIEEMKTLWSEMTVAIEKQKKITSSTITKMTAQGYRNKINNLLLPEAIGSVVCLAEALFILLKFQQLNTWSLSACGIAAVIILLVLPLLSIRAIHTMRSINLVGNNYKQTLSQYSKGKIQFVFKQKASLYLGAFLLVVALPVMGKLIADQDFFITTRLWLIYAIAFPFFYGFARWVFKSYNKKIAAAESMLNELEG